MLHDDKPSLSMCAFGAGAAHAALLALALPIMITLPAPADKAQGTVAVQVVVRSTPPPTLETAMAETAALPLPEYIGEGDIDEDALPASVLDAVLGASPGSDLDAMPASAVGEITGSLSQALASPDVLQTHAALLEVIATAPPPRTVEPAALPLVESVPAPDADGGIDGEAIASIESKEVIWSQEVPEASPAIVPVPLRKPSAATVVAPAPPVARKPVRKARAKPRSRGNAQKRTAPAQAKSPNKGFLGGRQAALMAEYPFANR
ncbi:MAG: hypothetical protein ACTSYK_05770 [Alphaproteobacteria bacterium]